jgi:hypothetical protein
MHKRGPKELELTLGLQDSNLLIKIKDNGIGVKSASEINKKIKSHKSFATSAIDKRIDLMNKFSKVPISIKMSDITKGTELKSSGTLIEISIPLKQKFE